MTPNGTREATKWRPDLSKNRHFLKKSYNNILQSVETDGRFVYCLYLGWGHSCRNPQPERFQVIFLTILKRFRVLWWANIGKCSQTTIVMLKNMIRRNDTNLWYLAEKYGWPVYYSLYVACQQDKIHNLWPELLGVRKFESCSSISMEVNHYHNIRCSTLKCSTDSKIYIL